MNPKRSIFGLLSTFLTQLILVTFLSTTGWTTDWASASHSGLPDEDPIIKDWRTRFAQGHQPTSQDLLDRFFTCLERRAIKHDLKSRYSKNLLSFELFDNIYMSKLEESFLDGVLFQENGTELLGESVSGNMRSYPALRMESKGNLIIEWSRSIFGYKPRDTQLDPLAHLPVKAGVVSYTFCIPAK